MKKFKKYGKVKFEQTPLWYNCIEGAHFRFINSLKRGGAINVVSVEGLPEIKQMVQPKVFEVLTCNLIIMEKLHGVRFENGKFI
jgi:hypothetical protein